MPVKEHEPDNKRTAQSRWPLYLSVFLMIGLTIAYFLIPSVQNFFQEAWEVLSSENEERISEWVGQFSWWGPLLIVLLMTLQIFLLMIPVPLLMIVTILAYGPWLGSLIILVAIVCASSFAYMLGFYLGDILIKKILGEKKEQKVADFVEDYGFWAVVLFRLSPFLSNDAVSIVSGMLQMKYLRFMSATVLGILPLTIIFAYLGESNDRLQSGLMWLGIISLAGFAGYVWWDKKKKSK